MKFDIHPSQQLVELFNKQPYQGQTPEKAKIIFLSSDANYSKEISEHRFFDRIIEYQEDGIGFWNKYGCHHPFLLEEFPFNKTSGGRPFHKNFSKIGLDSSYAGYISFVELLDVPTIGNKSENRPHFYSMVSIKHLECIDSIVNSDSGKLIFVSNGVLKDMVRLKKNYPVFDWLDYESGKKEQYLQDVASNRVHEIYHFSSSHIHRQLNQIKNSIDSWLN